MYEDLNGDGGQLNRGDAKRTLDSSSFSPLTLLLHSTSRLLGVGREHRWSVLASDTSRLASSVPRWLLSAFLPPHIKGISVAADGSAEFKYATNTMLIDLQRSA